MLSNHFILCGPLLFPPSIFPSTTVFSNESVLHIRWPKCWSFSFSISHSNEYSELISFRKLHLSEWVSEVTQSCPNLCDPVDCSLPGSSVHGTLQARILEWVTISFSSGSSPSRDQTRVSRFGCRHFNLWATNYTHFCFINYAKAFDYVDHNKLWKILKEMGISDHLTCLLRNFYAGQEATGRTGHGPTDWFQIGKGVHQGCILSPCLFNLYAEYIMRNPGQDEAQAGIKIAGRNINNLRYAEDTFLMSESEEELNSLLTKVKEESEKVGLKLNVQKTKIMTSGPITSWEIDGETVETVSDFIFLPPKSPQMVIASMKLKEVCSLEEKLWQSRQHVKKQRHYFVKKSPSSQNYCFSSSHVWIWELDYKESWAPKNNTVLLTYIICQ